MTWAARWLTWRVEIAKWLLAGSKYEVAVSEELRRLDETATKLIEYVEKSGGLRSPRRIRAYHEVRSRAAKLQALVKLALAA